MKKSILIILFLISSSVVFSQKKHKNEEANFSFLYSKDWKIDAKMGSIIYKKLPEIKISWKVIKLTKKNIFDSMTKLRDYKKDNCFFFKSKTLLKGTLKYFDSDIYLNKIGCEEKFNFKEIEYLYHIGSNRIRFYTKLPKKHINRQEEIKTILESVSLIVTKN